MAWTVDGLAYSNRKTLTIDATLIDADLDNCPVVAFITADAEIGAIANADGFDIRFTSSDGVTLLTYERESFSIAGGQATGVLHVKVPAVDSADDTIIYCYYRAADTADGSDGTAGNTWDANFKAVYHMNQDPSGGAPQILDSTANNKDLTSAGSMTSDDLVDAKVGKGLDFDGVDDFISGAALGSMSVFSVSAWVKPNGNQVSYAAIFADVYGGSNVNYTIHFKALETSLIVNGGFYDGAWRISPEVTLTDLVWAVLTLTYDGTIVRLYKDDGSSADSLYVGTPTSDNVGFRIARRWDNADYVKGIIDEVRISNIARTAPWIKASYNSQNGSLITWGAEEISAAAAGQHRSTIKWFTA